MTGRRLSYSIGSTLPASTPQLYRLIPERVWEAAIDDEDDEQHWESAGVADFTGLLRDKGLLDGWPPKMRVIVRRERPHAGAQLRFDDVDGYRLAAFATNTTSAPDPHLADLELRHRRRGRCENRIDVTAWAQMLAFTPAQDARRWEPKRLRLRLFTVSAALVRHGRQRWLHIKATAAWADVVVDGLTRIDTLTRPAVVT